MPTNTPKTHPITRRDATLYLDDGTATPIRLQIRILTGSITFGGYTVIRARDERGNFIGPARKGSQAGVSTIQINSKLHQAGGNATTAFLMDYINQTNLGTLTSTDTGTSDWKLFKVTLELADDGTNKGATYVLNDAQVQPGSSMNFAEDGFDITCTFESGDAGPTITENP